MANLYLRSGLRDAAPDTSALLTPCPLCAEPGGEPLPANSFGSGSDQKPFLAWATPDFDHVLVQSKLRLAPDAPAYPGGCDIYSTSLNVRKLCPWRLYEWDNGVVSYAAVLPDESAADGSIAGTGANSDRRGMRHAISDGSDGHLRLFFVQPTDASGHSVSYPGLSVSARRNIDIANSGRIFTRTDGASTFEANASERTSCAAELGGSPPCTPEPDAFAPATYLDASADGERLFFMTKQALTDDAPVSGEQKIYMYDATSPDRSPSAYE